MDASTRAKPIMGTGSGVFTPPILQNIEDTGLSTLWLQDLSSENPIFPGLSHGF